MHDHADSDLPTVLAEAVRRRRKDLRLRQVELAELAGCSTRFLHTVEAGKATVRFDKLLGVLRILGLRLHLEPSGWATDPEGEAPPA
jgi:y4mF family transcriptional regulator